MRPFAIYRKVMIFNWIRLGIGFLNCIIGLLIIGAAYLVVTNFEFDILTNIAIGCGAFLAIVILHYATMSRLGYSIRTGQLAVTERANSGREIPSNPIEYSKNIVGERFGSSRSFYFYSRDISIAVKQFMRVMSRGFSLNSDAPDFRTSRRVLMLLSRTAIARADDCCIAYALRRRDYELNAACVDALTILVQKWDAFVSRAFRLSLFVIIGCLLLFFIFWLPGLAVSRSLSVSSFPWMGISFLLMLSFKIAFFDSWAQTKMACEFLDISKETEIDKSLYQKLDAWSPMYANMRKKAQNASEKACGVLPSEIDSNDAEKKDSPCIDCKADDAPQENDGCDAREQEGTDNAAEIAPNDENASGDDINECEKNGSGAEDANENGENDINAIAANDAPEQESISKDLKENGGTYVSRQ